MTTGDTQPTQPLPPYTYAEPEPKRRPGDEVRDRNGDGDEKES